MQRLGTTSDEIGQENKLAEDFLHEINENNTLFLHLTDEIGITQSKALSKKITVDMTIFPPES